ncbi:RidA family protein [Candidatus Peregrinibacteria bacterium]|jgi:2-iminobutanoate/2-iminopropanoate deaminase|nr:RidA family protein [Candidatus Peregrinibacteria bacterium]MBT7736528.1 RidA family protein [Candidatus Peregrinibacteria bacterium]
MEVVKTDDAPQAIGPYSQAIKSGGFVFCSGQIPLKSDGQMVEGGVVEQANQVLTNLSAVLSAAGSDMNKAVKTTIYLDSMSDFTEVNEVYSKYFDNEIKPARATVEVATLPKNVKVEIDCIAEL